MTTTSSTPAHLPMLDWIGRIGAAGADELACRFGLSTPAVRARLAASERSGLVEAVRPLHGHPAVYVASRAGLRALGLADLAPCRVSPGGYAHLREVARTAVALERALPGAAVVGERELRAWEREAQRPLASAELGFAPGGGYRRHRPDLVVWPQGRAGDDGAPAVAIEVELTVKAGPRLAGIVRGWARSRLVAGVVYYAAPAAARALRRAVAEEQAEAMVHLLALDRRGELPDCLAAAVRSTSPVPSGA
ncbi:MAG: hypothetical protein QOE27_925 [Solirubrobacteraceae bacterium]|nr:hypothetical protein [Solirubrobacteraceae bacterium]